MKKTDKAVCVGKQNGYDIWRVVFEEDGHYFIKYKNQKINVDKDIAEKNYTYAANLR